MSHPKTIMRRLLSGMILAALLWVPGASSAGEPAVTLAGPKAAPVCRAGAKCRVKLKVTVRKGFHINSAKPADPNLIASRLSLKAPKGVALAAAVFPEPHQVDIPALGGKAAVHDGVFAITAEISVAAGTAPGRLPVEASLFYQACDNQMCFMPTAAAAKLEIEVK